MQGQEIKVTLSKEELERLNKADASGDQEITVTIKLPNTGFDRYSRALFVFVYLAISSMGASRMGFWDNYSSAQTTVKFIGYGVFCYGLSYLFEGKKKKSYWPLGIGLFLINVFPMALG